MDYRVKTSFTDTELVIRLGGIEKDLKKDIVDHYFQSILDDKTGKYFFISRRRVQWFLLKKIHLDDCTLTFEKLWDSEVKTALLEELAQVSRALYIIEDQMEWKVDDYIEKHGQKEDEDLPSWLDDSESYMKKFLEDHMPGYTNGCRDELDTVHFSTGKDDFSDDKAKKLVAHAMWSYMDGTESDWQVYDKIDVFTLTVMVYDWVLLDNMAESFDSFYFNSIDYVREMVGQNRKKQKSRVEGLLGVDKAKKLLENGKKLKAQTGIPLTPFQLYRLNDNQS